MLNNRYLNVYTMLLIVMTCKWYDIQGWYDNRILQVKYLTLTYRHTLNINSSRLSCTALSTAIYHGNEQIIENLLKYGADVNQLSADVYHARIESPLITACRMGHTGIARLLLQYGAHTHLTDW